MVRTGCLVGSSKAQIELGWGSPSRDGDPRDDENDTSSGVAQHLLRMLNPALRPYLRKRAQGGLLRQERLRSHTPRFDFNRILRSSGFRQSILSLLDAVEDKEFKEHRQKMRRIINLVLNMSGSSAAAFKGFAVWLFDILEPSGNLAEDRELLDPFLGVMAGTVVGDEHEIRSSMVGSALVHAYLKAIFLLSS